MCSPTGVCSGTEQGVSFSALLSVSQKLIREAFPNDPSSQRAPLGTFPAPPLLQCYMAFEPSIIRSISCPGVYL